VQTFSFNVDAPEFLPTTIDSSVTLVSRPIVDVSIDESQELGGFISCDMCGLPLQDDADVELDDEGLLHCSSCRQSGDVPFLTETFPEHDEDAVSCDMCGLSFVDAAEATLDDSGYLRSDEVDCFFDAMFLPFNIIAHRLRRQLLSNYFRAWFLLPRYPFRPMTRGVPLAPLTLLLERDCSQLYCVSLRHFQLARYGCWDYWD